MSSPDEMDDDLLDSGITVQSKLYDSPSAVVHGEEHWEVDCIVRSFTKGRRWQTLCYVVRWKETQETTEEPFECLVGTADEAIADFHFLNPYEPGPPPTFKRPNGWIPPPTPILLQLPTELIDRIACYCSTPEDWTILSLRATCRDIEFRTRSRWRNDWFWCRNVRLEMSKLRQLCEVSKRPELASQIMRVIVQCPHSASVDTGGGDRKEEKRRLRRVFQNLKRVTELQFTDWGEHLDKEIDPRTIDFQKLTIDSSPTFTAIVEAVEDCDLAVTSILSEIAEISRMPGFGMQDCHALKKMSRCFANVTTLGLDLLFESPQLGSGAEMTKRTQELAIGLMSLQKLQKLHLAFRGFADVSSIFTHLASTACLPQLHTVELESMVCRFNSIARFLRPFSRTLRNVEIFGAFLQDQDLSILTRKFRSFLEELGKCFDLTTLSIEDIDTIGYYLAFPGVSPVLFEDEIDDDGYTIIQTQPTRLLLDGHDLRINVIRAGRCLTWISGTSVQFEAA